jgi:O-antigen/teichoic acid export membrane protein
MTTNTARIAKNTLALYFRQILIMLVSLYTVRVALNTLGAEDYGIYNVVAGVVTMFSFLSNSMATASQRYFSFEIGRGNYEQLRLVFSLSLLVYMLIAVLVLILAETVGLWFVANKLIIPPERKSAALWVYQFSALSFLFTILATPYMAVIIAHEDMNIYAYVSIIESLLKLGIAVLLGIAAWDKLKLYGTMLCIVNFINTAIYRTVCIVKYHECKFVFYWNKSLFKEIAKFTGWNLFGGVSGVLKNQGINILLNIKFGPFVNAARAVAMQVNSAVLCFAQGFSSSMRPQIVKLYASGEIKEMLAFVFTAVKAMSYLLFLVILPLQLELPSILRLWLKDVPEYTVMFVRIILIETMVESISYPINGAWIAAGEIKLYQIITSVVLLLNLPLALVLTSFGVSSSGVLIMSVILSLTAFLLRLMIFSRQFKFPVGLYITGILIPVLTATAAGSAIPVIFSLLYPAAFSRIPLTILISAVSILAAVYRIGITGDERRYIDNILRKYFHRLRKKQTDNSLW